MMTKLTTYCCDLIERIELADSKDLKKLLLLILPSTTDMGMAISALVLKRHWLTDIGNYLQPAMPGAGDYLKITLPANMQGRTKAKSYYVQCLRVGNGMIQIQGSEGGTITECAWRSYAPYVCVVKKSNSISKSTDFRTARKLLFEATSNQLAHFLGLDFYVNASALSSKVYFICGHGNIGRSRDFIKLHGLNDSLLIDKNLFIRENMDEFNFYFRNSYNIPVENEMFRDNVSDLISNLGTDLSDEISLLAASVEKCLIDNDFNTPAFRELYERFVALLYNEHHDEVLSFENLKTFLIIREETFSLENIKCVIIHNAEIANKNQNNIDALVKSNIPVVVLQDRQLFDKENRDSLSKFIESNSDCYRFNWTKNKLSSLHDVADRHYWDYTSYTLAKRFQNQTVMLSKCSNEPNDIESLYYFFEVRGSLNQRNLPGYEQLRADYYKYLRPALYWIKNSTDLVESSSNKEIAAAMQNMTQSLNRVTASLQRDWPEHYSQIFEAVSKIESYTNINCKTCSPGTANIFNQRLDELGGSLYTIPGTNNFIFDVDETLQEILFTGVPYREKKKNYLADAIFRYFIPSTRVLLWCKEAQQIASKISTTYRAADGISDNLPIDAEIFWDYDIEDYDHVVVDGNCGQLDDDNVTTADLISYDSTQSDIETNYRYGTYQPHENGFQIRVKVIELSGNGRLFVSDKSKIFTLKKDKSFLDCKWNDIQENERVFTYTLTRQASIGMRDVSGISESFKDLDIWYSSLKRLWERFDMSYVKLQEFLSALNEQKKIRAAPELYNIKNWLYPGRLINAPDRENLTLILLACDIEHVDAVMAKVYQAKNAVEKRDRENRKKIKQQITKYMTRNKNVEGNAFDVNVNGVVVTVHHGIVTEKNSPENLWVDAGEVGQIFNN